MKYYHDLHKKEYDQISEEFWGGDAEKTAKNLYCFLRKYVPYDPEPDDNQTIKRPGRFIKDAYLGIVHKNDCKNYSSFICGVTDSLMRKGYPISGNYRFVSDKPGEDVHHVFAVVSDQSGSFWADPVLDRFNEHPNFYNVNDVQFNPKVSGVGRLTYMSGTEVGKFSLKNEIKKISHGLTVDAANAGKGVKKAAHSVAVNLANAKSLALHVGMAPARNALMALLDINAFNLAQRFFNGMQTHAAAIDRDWGKIGGNISRLHSAINNGMAFRKKHPKLSGCVGMGSSYHSNWITSHPNEWAHHYTRRNKSRRLNRMNGAAIGFEPVTTASLMALASALVAAFSKYLTPAPPATHQAMTDAAKKGTAAIVANAASANMSTVNPDGSLNTIDSNGNPVILPPNAPASIEAQNAKMATSAMQNATPSGAPSMSVSSNVDADGNVNVAVHDVNHPALDNAGMPDGGAASDQAEAMPEESKNAEMAPADKSAAPSKFSSEVTKGEEFVKKNWKPILIVGVVAIVGIKYGLPMLQKSFKVSKRR
jgi:hypothetical protein